ncbi:MAG: DUF2282 domain-containing protein [Rhodospirillales bacterium]|nr:DUF2282 domain-containing protein [Rhodospirillales bacterium]
MDRRSFAKTLLTSAVGLAALATTGKASAAMNAEMEKKLNHMLKMHPGASKSTIMHNMARVKEEHLARCYGVNAVGRNDCASGVHSCAGQSTVAHDPKSFVLLPSGDCRKIAGGSTKGPM